MIKHRPIPKGETYIRCEAKDSDSAKQALDNLHREAYSSLEQIGKVSTFYEDGMWHAMKTLKGEIQYEFDF